MIDTHAHLGHEYPFSIGDYVSQARAAGVHTIITIGTKNDDLEAQKKIAHQYSDIFFTVGIHPHDGKEFNETSVALMTALQADSKCVGIGEIGLDYHYNHSEPETQKMALARQLDLAAKWKKPVVIHSREAEADLLTLLTEYVSKTPLKKRPGAIHCFSGSYGFGKACLELGFYLSFSGIVTFKKAEEVQLMAKDTPADRLLIETDAPYLAPIPFRGKINQSAYLIETAKKIADLRKVPVEEIKSLTTANARALFNF